MFANKNQSAILQLSLQIAKMIDKTNEEILKVNTYVFQNKERKSGFALDFGKYSYLFGGCTKQEVLDSLNKVYDITNTKRALEIMKLVYNA